MAIVVAFQHPDYGCYWRGYTAGEVAAELGGELPTPPDVRDGSIEQWRAWGIGYQHGFERCRPLGHLGLELALEGGYFY